jgi:glycosyltransferase involved in cell wall biosynthesis
MRASVYTEFMKSANKKEKILLLPHWTKGGGSGYYIQNLIDKLNDKFIVHVQGFYSAEYSEHRQSSKLLNDLSLLSFPAYEGIKKSSTLYHLLTSLGRIALIFSKYGKASENETPSAIIFTSSIQAVAIPAAKYLFPRSKIVIAIQENIKFSSISGRLMLRLLKNSDIVISITKQWAAYAQGFGVSALILRNQYDPSYFAPECNQANPIESDLLYIGGDAGIKGFDFFKKALPALLQRPGIKILCLGHYATRSRQFIRSITENSVSGSKAVIVGHVSDIRPYLRGTKLLMLPITSPHFCRPAIEAGFFGKTFVIPEHSGLEDFVQNGVNCISFNLLSESSFVRAIHNLLDDPMKLNAMGAANLVNSKNFISNEHEFDSLECNLHIEL